jgi:hypothetical protein
LARKSIVFWAPELVFVFGFDPYLAEGRIDSAETWLELAFIGRKEENNMPLCRNRYWLVREMLDLSKQFVLGGVVSLLVVRSYKMVAVVVLSQYLLAVSLPTISEMYAARGIND